MKVKIKYYSILESGSSFFGTPKLIKIKKAQSIKDTESFCRAYASQNKLLYVDIGGRNRFLSSIHQFELGRRDFKIDLPEKAFNDLKRIWFIYGNKGVNHCDYGHKFIQKLLEGSLFDCLFYKKIGKDLKFEIFVILEDCGIITY
jgi:hypothetical protein